MMKTAGLKKIAARIAMAILALAVIIFGIYNVLWLWYIKTNFDPFLKNERLEKVSGPEHIAAGAVYVYQDRGGDGYNYQLNMPHYLEFWSGIAIYTPVDVEMDGVYPIYFSDYGLSLMLCPETQPDILTIYDYTGNDGGNAAYLYVDQNGAPIAPSPGDPFPEYQEYYEKGLALYDKFNEPIMDLFSNMKEILG